MPRVLIVSYMYYPSAMVASKRIHQFQTCLAGQGIEARILTVSQLHQLSPDPALDMAEFDSGVERTSTIGPFRVPSRLPSEDFLTGLRRRARYLVKCGLDQIVFPDEFIGWLPFAVRKGIQIHRRWPFDLILSSGMPWTNFLVGDILSRILNIPHILDYRDPWTVYEKTQFTSPIRKHLSKWYEKGLVKRSFAIVANTDAVSNMFRNVFGPQIQTKLSVVRNGYDPDSLHKHRRRFPQAITEKGRRFTLVHAGMYYTSRSVAALMKAIHSLKNRSILSSDNFQFVSYGRFLKEDRLLLERLNLQDLIQECDYLSYGDMMLELAKAGMNLLVIGSDHWPQVPGKLYDYFIAGRPILCLGPKSAEAVTIIHNTQYGTFADINNPLHVAETLCYVLERFRSGALDGRLCAPAEYSVVEEMKKMVKTIHAFGFQVGTRKEAENTIESSDPSSDEPSRRVTVTLR